MLSVGLAAVEDGPAATSPNDRIRPLSRRASGSPRTTITADMRHAKTSRKTTKVRRLVPIMAYSDCSAAIQAGCRPK